MRCMKRMATKTTFIWYYDWLDYADAMTDAELWMLFRKILQHVNDEEEIELPLELKLVWAWIKKKLDEQKEKWERKVETIKQQNSEKGKNHTWNQYTKWDEERKGNDKAQKNTVEQMEQNGTNGTNGTMSWYTNTISSFTTTSSKKEERNKKKEEMILAVKNHPKLSNIIREEDLNMWLDYKIDKKQPYKNARSFCTYLVSTLKTVSYWRVQLDLSKRFSYAVDIAIAQWWDWIHWYDWMELDYQKSKKDLFPNPEEDE